MIVSPPRCGSTVLARSLWQHGAFRWYLHEPLDWTYHGADGAGAMPPELGGGRLLDRALFSTARPAGLGAVIKEMTFQAGDSVAAFTAATVPVVFLVRDPRLAVLSRMRRRERDGDNPAFPGKEAGWKDLRSAVGYFREIGADYLIVDIADLRRNPGAALPLLCQRLGLDWDPGMLSWDSVPHLKLGNIGGAQDSWYTRVLASTTWEGPDQDPPSPSVFRSNGMLDIVLDALDIYREIRLDPLLLTLPDGHPSPSAR